MFDNLELARKIRNLKSLINTRERRMVRMDRRSYRYAKMCGDLEDMKKDIKELEDILVQRERRYNINDEYKRK